MESLVSIIIPVYNAEPYLAQTIQSAFDQSWANKEIIVVDDGSTDRSLEIARKFENQTIKVFTQENKGGSAARNLGLSKSKGDYIQFLDADDLLSPEKIEVQLKRIQHQPGKLAICPTVYFFDGEDPFNLQPSTYDSFFLQNTENGFEFLLNLYGSNAENKAGMITTNSWLTPKDLIEKAGGWDESLIIDQDGEFFCRVVLQGTGIEVENNGIAYYRKYKNGKSTSTPISKKHFYGLLAATEKKHNSMRRISSDPRIDEVIARAYKALAVKAYPAYRDISTIALERAAILGGSDYVPAIGGRVLETLKDIFGWKAAKWLSYIKQNALSK